MDDLRVFKTVVTSGDWRFSTGFAKAIAPNVKKTAKKEATRENNMMNWFSRGELEVECVQVLVLC